MDGWMDGTEISNGPKIRIEKKNDAVKWNLKSKTF